MKLCVRIEGVRERLRDGSLTLDAAAQLQAAFERRDRERAREARSATAGAGSAARPYRSAPAGPARPPAPKPMLDMSAQKALVEEAVGKSTRQVMQMLAEVDPALVVPSDKVRPLSEGRWEFKVAIDTECQRGLEQLKGLLSHVDPHMTLGQLVGRLVKEGLERHDPSRPRRSRRTANRTADAERTSAPKRPAQPACTTTSAPKSRAPGRAIPAAVERETWQRYEGRCGYIDARTGRRCASRHLLQVDHVFPYALGGGAEPANLRLLCAAHHRHRHAGGLQQESLPSEHCGPTAELVDRRTPPRSPVSPSSEGRR